MDIGSALEKLDAEFPFQEFYAQEGVGKDTYKNIARHCLEFLPEDASILDFGSGPCDKTVILQWLGFNCSACDDLNDDWHLNNGNREKIIGFAKNNGIDFRLMKDNEFPDFKKNHFDMVMLNDVLEHLHDSPKVLLENLITFLKPDGLIMITVPNAVNIRKRLDVLRGKTNLPPFDSYYNYPGKWRGHIREYVRDDLYQLAKFLNLKILKLTGCDHMTEKLPENLRWLYLQITRFFPGLKDSWLLIARKT
jgi:SAM-dependent methyltransferase